MKDTKKEILDNAILLFSQKGYHSVSIKELASSVNIKDSSIYSHYSSKREILDTIFNKFMSIITNFYMDEATIISHVEKNISAKDILRKIVKIPPSISERLFIIRATRILFIEQFNNPKARELISKYSIEIPQKTFKYALDVLIEYNKISKVDTDYLSYAWVALLYYKVSQSVLLLNSLSEEQMEDCLDGLTNLQNFIIDATLTFK